MENRRDAESLKALEQGLNREAEKLSPQIQARLQQARQQALLELNTQYLTKSQSGFATWFSYLSIFDSKRGVVLAGLVVAMVLSLGIQVSISPSSDKSLGISEAQPKNSADVLMSNEDIEFLENMDIYEWLAAEYS